MARLEECLLVEPVHAFLELLYDIAVEVRCVQDEQGCRFDQVCGPRRRNARRRVIRERVFLSGKVLSWPNSTVAATDQRASRHPPIDARAGSMLSILPISNAARWNVMTAQIEAVDFFAFDNSYARLPGRFCAASARSRSRPPSSSAEQGTCLASQARSGKACRTGGCGDSRRNRVPKM